MSFILYQDPGEPKPNPVTLGDADTYPAKGSPFARAIVSSLKRDTRDDIATIRYWYQYRNASQYATEHRDSRIIIRTRIANIRRRARYIQELS